jgi:hypothetical protein
MSDDAIESNHSDYHDPHHFFAAWGAATARYWIRRAEMLERARPVPGEFHGLATHEQLSEQWRRLTAKAEACRHRAEIAKRYGATPADRALIVDVASALVVAG